MFHRFKPQTPAKVNRPENSVLASASCRSVPGIQQLLMLAYPRYERLKSALSNSTSRDFVLTNFAERRFERRNFVPMIVASEKLAPSSIAPMKFACSQVEP